MNSLKVSMFLENRLITWKMNISAGNWKKSSDNEEIERTKEITVSFDTKNGEELTKLYLRSDVIQLVDVFEKVFKVSTKEYGFINLYCVNLHGYTYQFALKYTDDNLQILQDKDSILLLNNKVKRSISSVKGDRYVVSDDNKKIL